MTKEEIIDFLEWRIKKHAATRKKWWGKDEDVMAECFSAQHECELIIAFIKGYLTKEDFQ